MTPTPDPLDDARATRAPSDAYLRVLADLDAQWQVFKQTLFGVAVGGLFVLAMLVGGR
jgi:hypothetical protein